MAGERWDVVHTDHPPGGTHGGIRPGQMVAMRRKAPAGGQKP
jgi:hypothetical protein